MRHQQRLRAGMLFTASLWMVGCQPTPHETTINPQTTSPRLAQQIDKNQMQQFQIEVAPVLAECVGVVPMQCLQYRKIGDTAWLNHYSGIVGFDYQPDYRYVLEIKQSAVNNPPADASSLRWELVRIIEKHPVTQ